MKYEINVTKIDYSRHVYEIEADSEVEAIMEAREMAHNDNNWEIDSTEFDAYKIEE